MRIDLTTREWHELIKPVIPHASTDKDQPGVGVVRLEAGARALYAVATDRHTIGAERFPLPPGEIDWERSGPAVHVRLAEAKASLGMFRYDKDDDPQLRVTIDRSPVTISVAGRPDVLYRHAVTIESEDGTRVVMHDARDPSRDPLAGWHRSIRTALARPDGRALDGLDLSAVMLARWQAAVRRGERLTVWTGPKAGDPLLVTVDQHFAGVWAQESYLEDEHARSRAESRWLGELPDTDPAGLLRTGSGTVTTIDVPDPALLRQAAELVITSQTSSQSTLQRRLKIKAPQALLVLQLLEDRGIVAPADDAGTREVLVEGDGLAAALEAVTGNGAPPWVSARFTTACMGCEATISPGDQIQSDSEGGWVCEACGTGEDEAGE